MVFPSPRTSGRVPFGTGAAIQKMKNVLDYQYKTYDLNAFNDLSFLIENVENIFIWDEVKTEKFLLQMKQPLQSFLIENKFVEEIREIKQNAKNPVTFSNRFFRWFNAFKVIKYMNYSHESFYNLKPVTELVQKYFETIGVIGSNNPEELLAKFREMANKKATSFLR
jgi:hypothetical protein